MFTIGREELLRNITAMGAARCLYNAFSESPEAWLAPNWRCDCKYGGTGKGEDSGCPELRSVAGLLSAMSDIEYRELRRSAGMTILEEDLGNGPEEGPCPTCGSKNPAWHPAVQFEGEVQLCSDPWHKPTKEEIEAEWAERERRKRNEHVIEGLRHFTEAPADIQQLVLANHPELNHMLRKVMKESRP